MMDMGILRFLAAQELASGREIEEQLPDLHAGAGRTPGRSHLEQLAPVDHDLRGHGGVALPLARGHGQAADTRDARQRLTPKAHGGNGAQVLGPLNFARRVSLQAEQRVIPAHAKPIVRHADQTPAPRLNLHGDACGLGIQGILDQLLDHAGRTLHHFAGGNLVGNQLGQETNAVHGAGCRAETEAGPGRECKLSCR